MINIKRDELELVKKYLPYLVIMGLAWSLYNTFLMYADVQEKRILEMKENRDTYKEGFFKTNEILQDHVKYEGITIIDTLYDSRPVYRGPR